METPKSANQLHKESGSPLSFKDWIAQGKGENIYVKRTVVASCRRSKTKYQRNFKTILRK